MSAAVLPPVTGAWAAAPKVDTSANPEEAAFNLYKLLGDQEKLCALPSRMRQCVRVAEQRARSSNAPGKGSRKDPAIVPSSLVSGDSDDLREMADFLAQEEEEEEANLEEESANTKGVAEGKRKASQAREAATPTDTAATTITASKPPTGPKLGAKMTDDIGLLSAADAEKEEAEWKAAHPPSGAYATSDNGAPRSHEHSILSIASLVDLEKKWSAAKIDWLTPNEPDVRIHGFIQDRVGAERTGNFSFALRNITTSPIFCPKERQSKKLQPLTTMNALKPEFNLENALSGLSGMQAHIVVTLAQCAGNEEDVVAMGSDPALAARLSAAEPKPFKPEQSAVEAELSDAYDRLGADVEYGIADRFLALQLEALVADGVIRRSATGNPVMSKEDFGKLAVGPALLRSMQLIRQTLLDAGILVLTRDPRSVKGANAYARRVHNTINFSYNSGQKTFYCSLPIVASGGNVHWPMPNEPFDPPAETGPRYFHITGQDSARPIATQIRLAFPTMTAVQRQNAVNTVLYLDLRLQGQHISHVDGKKAHESARGLYEFLHALITPFGVKGGLQRLAPRGWRIIRHSDGTTEVFRGSIVRNLPGGGGAEARNTSIATVRNSEVAYSARAMAEDFLYRSPDLDWITAEDILQAHLWLNDAYGFGAEIMAAMEETQILPPYREGDDVFQCRSCFQVLDVVNLRFAEPGQGFPTDWPICSRDLVQLSTGAFESPFYSLRRTLSREGPGGPSDDASETCAELRKRYITVHSDAYKASDGTVPDAYLPGELRLVHVETASPSALRASLDAVGILPSEDAKTFLKHSDLRNVLPTTSMLNLGLQRDPRIVSQLIAIQATLAAAAAHLSDSQSSNDDLTFVLDIGTRIDKLRARVIDAARSYGMHYINKAWLLDPKTSLAEDKPLLHFLAAISLIDEVVEETTQLLAGEHAFPSCLRWYLLTFPYLKDVYDEVELDRLKTELKAARAAKDQPFVLPSYPNACRYGFDSSEDCQYAFDLIEKLRRELRPDFAFATCEDGEPSFLSAEEMALLEEKLGRKIKFVELLCEARLRFWRLVFECDKRYIKMHPYPIKKLFVLIFVELYIQLLLGEGLDALGGAIFFMHGRHGNSGGMGHAVQGQPMTLGNKIVRPKGPADYDLTTRNIRRRRWTSRNVIVSMQRLQGEDADNLREGFLRSMFDRSLDHLRQGRLQPLLSPAESVRLADLLESVRNRDLLVELRRRGYF